MNGCKDECLPGCIGVEETGQQVVDRMFISSEIVNDGILVTIKKVRVNKYHKIERFEPMDFMPTPHKIEEQLLLTNKSTMVTNKIVGDAIESDYWTKNIRSAFNIGAIITEEQASVILKEMYGVTRIEDRYVVHVGLHGYWYQNHGKVFIVIPYHNN